MINHSKKTILLIDDDPIANIISTRIIKRTFSGNVVTFSNGREALDKIRECWSLAGPTSSVVIFLDINMPHMDGWEFLEEFEQLPEAVRGKCHLAMLTSSINSDDIERSKSYKSVKEFISKPLTADKLAILNQIDVTS